MESIADSLSNSYQDFVAAAAGVLEAKEQSNGQKTSATDAALESFKQCWELFKVSCDQAEELVESLKQRIGSECLVDEATGAAPTTTGSGSGSRPEDSGIPPISAVRLEQMSKAVRWLVIELQHGSGAAAAAAAAAPNPQPAATPFDDAPPH